LNLEIVKSIAVRGMGKKMTGSKKKLNFFMPKLAFPLAYEVLRLKKNSRKQKPKQLKNKTSIILHLLLIKKKIEKKNY
jgi:hypothetical protein